MNHEAGMKTTRALGALLALLILAGIAGPAAAQTMNSVVARSMYSDQKAFGEGDTITIMIVEFTKGSNETDTRTNSDTRTIADINTTGSFNDILPTLGFNSEMQNRNESSGGTESTGMLESRMTAVVNEVLENGLLVIEGTRTIEVNGEIQTTTISGTVRPEDVGSNNTVFSYNVANVQIAYSGDGMVNDAGKPGMLTRVWNWIF